MLPNQCFINKIGSKIVLFQEKQFCERGAPPVNSIKSTNIQSNIRDKIQNNHRREALVTKLCKEKPTLFQDEDKLLYYEDQVYILPNKKLQEQLLNNNYDAPIAGHPRVFKTYKLINWYYWWLSQLKDIKTYIEGCSTCQQNKASRQKKATPLNPHPLPESPWESILLDIIGLLPESNGFNAILSVIDQFSKMIHLIPSPATRVTLGIHINRHYRATAQVQWIQCHLISHWPILQDDLPYSNNHRVINERIDQHLPKTDLEAAWNP